MKDDDCDKGPRGGNGIAQREYKMYGATEISLGKQVGRCDYCQLFM